MVFEYANGTTFNRLNYIITVGSAVRTYSSLPECGKIWVRKTQNTDTSHVVAVIVPSVRVASCGNSWGYFDITFLIIAPTVFFRENSTSLGNYLLKVSNSDTRTR